MQSQETCLKKTRYTAAEASPLAKKHNRGLEPPAVRSISIPHQDIVHVNKYMKHKPLLLEETISPVYRSDSMNLASDRQQPLTERVLYAFPLVA